MSCSRLQAEKGQGSRGEQTERKPLLMGQNSTGKKEEREQARGMDPLGNSGCLPAPFERPFFEEVPQIFSIMLYFLHSSGSMPFCRRSNLAFLQNSVVLLRSRVCLYSLLYPQP